MLEKLNFSVLTITCIAYTLIFNYLSIVNFGRSPSALQTNAYQRLATVFAIAITLIALENIITSKKVLTANNRLSLGILILFWAYALVNNYSHNARFSLQVILFPLTMFSLLISSEYQKILKAIAIAGAVIIFICVWMLITNPEIAFYNGSNFIQDKAIIGNRILAGPFSHPNSLGAAMLIISPAYLSLKEYYRNLLLLLSFVVILMTGSRTSIFSFLIWILILVLPAGRVLRKRILLLATFFSFILMILLPFATSQIGAFSNRGQIWINSRDYISRNPIFGYGVDFYSQQLGRNSNFISTAVTGHNLMIDILIKYGIVGILLLLIFFLIQLTRVYRSKHFSMIQGSYFFLLFLSGITETHLSFPLMGEIGFFFWIMFPIVMLKDSAAEDMHPR
ncbi:MAG: O-antigen ligase family protein [Actinobacteria bacterium]|nr:O-antigen ligase family protein [Actinomycetota bacterium]